LQIAFAEKQSCQSGFCRATPGDLNSFKRARSSSGETEKPARMDEVDPDGMFRAKRISSGPGAPK